MTEAEEARILLIDDDRTLLEYLANRLQRDGYSVRTTYSGEEALEVVIKEDFDVAVVDLKMPGMDGIETQRRLKELLPLLQCVVLTAYGSVETALKSGQVGAYDYLFKPIDYDSLTDTIEGALEEKRALERIRSEREEASQSSSRERGARTMWNVLREAWRSPSQ